MMKSTFFALFAGVVLVAVVGVSHQAFAMRTNDGGNGNGACTGGGKDADCNPFSPDPETPPVPNGCFSGVFSKDNDCNPFAPDLEVPGKGDLDSCLGRFGGCAQPDSFSKNSFDGGFMYWGS